MSRREEFVSIKYGSEKIPKQNHLLLVNLKELYEQFQWNNSGSIIIIIIIIIIFIYLPSDVISQEKTATSSRSITKASKYAIPLKPTHKLAESKRYLVTW